MAWKVLPWVILPSCASVGKYEYGFSYLKHFLVPLQLPSKHNHGVEVCRLSSRLPVSC